MEFEKGRDKERASGISEIGVDIVNKRVLEHDESAVLNS